MYTKLATIFPVSSFCSIFFLSMFVETHSYTPAILHLQSGDKAVDVCAVYNPYYSAIPEELKHAPKYRIYFPFPRFNNGCIEHFSKEVWNSSVFVPADGNCSFFEKLQSAYQSHAKQVILLSKSWSLNDFPVGSAKQHKQVHLSVGMIPDESWKKVVNSIGTPEYSQLYHPRVPPFDPCLVVIWIIAVFTVVVGAYLSGETLKHSIATDTNEGDSNTVVANYRFPPLSIKMVAVLIVMICLVLLLLYYFYKYLIYVFIGIFAVAAVQGTYDCLSGVRSWVNYGRCKVPENNLPLLKYQPEICSIILLLFCIGLSIFWIIVRNDFYAWMLQDFLGVCFCISLLKTFRLPSLKISAILLLALLIYDIFFVFITPFFSAQGKSVMVEVATGHGSLEQLPMVIKVPKMIKTAMSLCERPYSLLGFGDILLPGLFVSFCHNFDVIAKTKCRVYFVATSIAYAFGLFITFIALLLMKSGQPALLYLAPSVLIAAVLVALCRKELKELWNGQIDPNKRNINPGSSQDNIQPDGEACRQDEEEHLIAN